MPNTVHNSCFLHTLKGFADLCFEVEGLLVEEGIDLGSLVHTFDLGKDQLDRVEVESIWDVPHGHYAQLLHPVLDLLCFVYSQVVHEDVDFSAGVRLLDAL